ncbi:MAG: alpha/beta hydrolase [Deltaproteobacteria bacterium]|nr:alpha/beta hydrolase [Deltaproteobacteria bacterium]
MPYVDDHGVKLWYRVSGSGEPLVLSGGFGLLHNQFDHVLELLAREFQVIDWNYRGAGESDRAWVGGYTLDRWVDDLELILSHLKVQNAHLWGTSTGAPLSIRYAARYPQRVKSVMVYPSFKAGVTSRKMFQVFQDITEVFGYEALARFTSWIGCADQNVFSQVGNDVAVFEAEAFKRNFSIESLAKTLEVFSHIDLTSDVEKLTMPVLVLLGDSGKLGGKAAAMKETIPLFQRHCPHSQVVQVKDGGGTYCMIEQPQETARAVSAFIASLRNT